MSEEIPKFALPFAVVAEDRKAPFTEDREAAAILCLAELEREKGGGLVLKREAEELVFVAEACYPLWLVPLGGRSLLFDGLGAVTYTLLRDVLPDTQAFINDLEGSAKTREAYSAFLPEHLNLFRDFKGQEEERIEGLIADPDLLGGLASYLEEARAVRKPMVDQVILSPVLDESGVASSLRELLNSQARLKTDISHLRQAMELLNSATKTHTEAIHEEIMESRAEFDAKIEAARSSAMEKTRGIQKKYDQEIAKRSREFDRQLQDLHRELAGAEKDIERLSSEISRCEDDIASCRQFGDRAGELQWRQRQGECRKALSATEKSAKDLERRIEEAGDAKRQEVARIRAEYNAQAEAAMEELRALEASREAFERMRREEIQKLEDLSSTIVDQIDRLLERKRAALRQFDGISIAKRRRKQALVYLPFYLACFRRETKRRYVVYPPSRAGGMRALRRFRGVLRGARIKSLLEPRSRPLADFLNQLIPLIARNPIFENEIGDAGKRADLLRTRKSRQEVSRGLEELKGEGWISEEEFSRFDSLISERK